jgi:tRNA threonylcarbamoyladenosine biosynthesis protein TsaE
MEARGAPASSFDSPDPETTFEIAALLGRSIGARGLAIGLVGPLGSGKTVFVKGLAEGLGVDPRIVSSPTFVIAQQYAIPAGLPTGPETLHHLDFYRLASEAELESIGFLDWLRPGQVLAIEWLDRFPDVVGEARLLVEFLPMRAGEGEWVDTGRRHLRATAHGDEAARILRDWRERWERLERERSAGLAAGGGGSASGSRSADAKLVVALVVAGLLGLRVVGRPPEPGPPACARLAPATASVPFGAPARDALGDLAVVCAEQTEPPESAAGLAGIARLLDGRKLDPNTAPRSLLENLPGIGPGRAAAIVAERALSPFRSTGELERVPGIGPKTRAKLEPFLEVDSGRPPG